MFWNLLNQVADLKDLWVSFEHTKIEDVWTYFSIFYATLIFGLGLPLDIISLYYSNNSRLKFYFLSSPLLSTSPHIFPLSFSTYLTQSYSIYKYYHFICIFFVPKKIIIFISILAYI